MIDAAIQIISGAALLAGGVFYLIGAVGLNRMPDVFSRMHAVSVSDTLGAGLLVFGMILQAGDALVVAKLVIILLVLAFSGAVAIHALARAALHDGLKPLVAAADGTLSPAETDQEAITVDALAAQQAGGSPPSKR